MIILYSVTDPAILQPFIIAPHLTILHKYLCHLTLEGIQEDVNIQHVYKLYTKATTFIYCIQVPLSKVNVSLFGLGFDVFQLLQNVCEIILQIFL